MLNSLGKLLSGRFAHNPIFIVGTGRSGTTVLSRALGNHPRIFSAGGESPFISHIGSVPYTYENSELRDYRMTSLQFSGEYLHDAFRRLCIESALGKNYGLITILKNAARGRLSLFRNTHWCAKTFPTYGSFQGLTALYPNAKFIYIFRNGIDVVQSRTRFAGFRQQEFSAQCSAWAQSAVKYEYMSTVESAIQVRHEDLVNTPEQVFQKIFSFVGVEHSSKPLDFITNTIVHPLDKPTEKGTPVKEIFKNREPAHTHWTSEQKELFKQICGDAMGKLGYEIPF